MYIKLKHLPLSYQLVVKVFVLLCIKTSKVKQQQNNTKCNTKNVVWKVIYYRKIQHSLIYVIYWVDIIVQVFQDSHYLEGIQHLICSTFLR